MLDLQDSCVFFVQFHNVSVILVVSFVHPRVGPIVGPHRK